MTCQELQQFLTAGSLIRNCEPMRRVEGLRIQTRFRYPGGEYVDLFWRPPTAESAAEARGGELLDYGQTISQLLSMGVDPDRGGTRKTFVQDTCHALNVEKRGGEFVVPLVENPNGLAISDAVIRLAQVCVRVADLFVTHRYRPTSVFSADLEEGLESLEPPFDRDVELTGRNGRRVRVDYVVHGPTRESALLSLSASNPSTAQSVAKTVFTKWFDLLDHQTDYQFATVVDSQKFQLFREDDLERLELVSSVISYPDEADRLRDLLIE